MSFQVSLDDHAFNKQQTLCYVKGYAHEAPEMTVQDPRVPSGLTEVYRSGGYNPATYTGSPTYSSAKKEETLPDWVVNNNKVSTPQTPQGILDSTHPAGLSYFLHLNQTGPILVPFHISFAHTTTS